MQDHRMAAFGLRSRLSLGSARLALLSGIFLAAPMTAGMAQDAMSEAQDLLARQVEGTGREMFSPETAVEFKASDNVFVTSALAIDFTEGDASVKLPLYRGLSPEGEPVYYIITEASDFEVAKQMGINFSPKMRHAAGTPARRRSRPRMVS